MINDGKVYAYELRILTSDSDTVRIQNIRLKFFKQSEQAIVK